ncbi:MAG: DMT family transporter [Pseudomonadota bacterium]
MASFLTALFNNAPFLLVFVTLSWGGNAVAGRLAVGHVSPLLLTEFRWVITALVLLAIGHHHLRKDWPVIRQNIPKLMAMGASGFAIFNFFLYSALVHTTAINVTIIQAAMPMFIFILSFVVFRVATHWAQVAGYSVTLIGVVIVAAQGDPRLLLELNVNYGDFLMLIAAFIYGAYSAALQAKPDIHWVSMLAVMAISAALVSVPAVAYEVATDSLIFPSSFRAWAVVVFTAVFPAMLAQGLFIKAVEIYGPNRAGLYLNLVPIFGALLAVLILGEAFHLYHAVALVLVIGGILLAQRLTREA